MLDLLVNASQTVGFQTFHANGIEGIFFQQFRCSCETAKRSTDAPLSRSTTKSILTRMLFSLNV
jgi:hypothetical protein